MQDYTTAINENKKKLKKSYSVCVGEQHCACGDLKERKKEDFRSQRSVFPHHTPGKDFFSPGILSFFLRLQAQEFLPPRSCETSGVWRRWWWWESPPRPQRKRKDNNVRRSCMSWSRRRIQSSYTNSLRSWEKGLCVISPPHFLPPSHHTTSPWSHFLSSLLLWTHFLRSSAFISTSLGKQLRTSVHLKPSLSLHCYSFSHSICCLPSQFIPSAFSFFHSFFQIISFAVSKLIIAFKQFSWSCLHGHQQRRWEFCSCEETSLHPSVRKPCG